jgi:hypothetical protein
VKRLSKHSWSILLQTVPGAAPFACIFSYFLFSSAYAILDTNNNGLSDVWERTYNGGHLFSSINPQADDDGDGWTNEQESAAGTDPFDSNAPDGFVRLQTAHIPEVLGEINESGIPDVITPEAVTVTWPTIPGKQYTLLYSPDLVEWLLVPDETFIGNGSEVEYAFLLPGDDKLFWRVNIEDVDSDDDGLTDAEEAELETNPFLADTDGDGWNDLTEIQQGTSTTNPDTDGDGIPDSIDTSPMVADQTDFNPSALIVISPQQ